MLNKDFKIFQLRRGQEQVYWGVVALIEEALKENHLRLYREISNIPQTIAASYHDLTIWGLISGETEDLKYKTIRFLGVASNFAKRGIGRELVKFLESLAEKQGALGVKVQTNLEIADWYERLGYAPILARDRTIIMAKEIKCDRRESDPGQNIGNVLFCH